MKLQFKWRDIKGYEGYYEISNTGVVKGCERQTWNGKVYIINKEQILKPYISMGYYKVDLYREGKRRRAFIH